MKYQLVLQFPEELYGYLDWIEDFEDKLERRLTNSEIDGHDIGSGEVNIFIHTNNAVATFAQVKVILNEDNYLENTKAVYRDFNEDQYICLWPK